MSRVVALVVLTAAFVPAAVLGALPLVAPTVGLVTVLALLILDREPGSVPAAAPGGPDAGDCVDVDVEVEAVTPVEPG
jgi:hypothetical protein